MTKGEPMTTKHIGIELLKAPISDIRDTGFTINIGAQYGSPTSIRVLANTTFLDLREGDILTIYTAVLTKGQRMNGESH